MADPNTDDAPVTVAPATDASWGDNDPVAPTGNAYLATLDPGRAAMVKAIGDGKMTLPKATSRGGVVNPQTQALIADVAQYNPGFDDADAPSRIAARKAYTSGKQGQNITSFNTALDHLNYLDQAVTGLGNVQSIPYTGTTHILNTVRNAFRSADGNTDVAGFQGAVPNVLDELVKAVRGTGGNEADIQRLSNAFNTSQSQPQQRKVIQEWAQQLNGRINEMRNGYQTAIGTTAEDIPGISPDAQAHLQAFLSPDYVNKGLPAAAPSSGPPAVGPGDPPPDGGGTPPTGGPAGPTGGSPTPEGTPPGYTGPSTDGSVTALATGSTRTEHDPVASALIDKLVRSGANADQINAELANQKLNAGIGAIPQSQVDAAQAYLKQHPNYAGSFGSVDRQVANSLASRVAASPVGAAIVGAGNAASFGLGNKIGAGVSAVSDRLAGDDRGIGQIYDSNLADANNKSDLLAQANPLSTLGGEAAGFLTGDALIGRGLKAAGDAVPQLAALGSKIPVSARPFAQDLAYGGAYGAGSTDHLSDLPGNVAEGAGIAALGGSLGRGLIRGGAAIASPIANEAVQRLTDAGVTLTPGQILGASGTRFGNFVKNTEDKAISKLGIGDFIASGRRDGVKDFNIANAKDALSIVGKQDELPGDIQAGHDLTQHLQNVREQVYDDALGPLRATPDGQLQSDVSDIRDNVRPDQQAAYKKTLMQVVAPHLPSPGEDFTGNQIQMIKRGLNEKIAQYGKDANGSDLAGDLSDLRDSFLNFARRQDPENAAKYAQADAFNAHLERINDAASKTKDGVYTPQQWKTAVGRLGYGTTKANLAAGSAPFQQLAIDASNILPSSIPDSGTAGRLDIANLGARLGGGAALGGSAGYLNDGASGALKGAALGAALFSRPGLKIAQHALAGSREGIGSRIVGSTALGATGAGIGYSQGGVGGALAGGAVGAFAGNKPQTLGDLLRAHARIGGAVGTPLLLQSVSRDGE